MVRIDAGYVPVPNIKGSKNGGPEAAPLDPDAIVVTPEPSGNQDSVSLNFPDPGRPSVLDIVTLSGQPMAEETPTVAPEAYISQPAIEADGDFNDPLAGADLYEDTPDWDLPEPVERETPAPEPELTSRERLARALDQASLAVFPSRNPLDIIREYRRGTRAPAPNQEAAGDNPDEGPGVELIAGELFSSPRNSDYGEAIEPEEPAVTTPVGEPQVVEMSPLPRLEVHDSNLTVPASGLPAPEPSIRDPWILEHGGDEVPPNQTGRAQWLYDVLPLDLPSFMR